VELVFEFVLIRFLFALLWNDQKLVSLELFVEELVFWVAMILSLVAVSQLLEVFWLRLVVLSLLLVLLPDHHLI
jgi:hypothetical protein